MQESKQIDKYTLSRMTNFSNIRAVIWLTSNQKTIARLEFRHGEVPAKLTVQEYPWGQVLWIYYPIDAFTHITDILRNEKPVWLTYEISTGYARIETGDEPVGEGENSV